MVDFRDIEFTRAARSPADFPRDGRPQVCFAGRSNVGKSSLLNTLVGRSNIARISKTPGRTREIHFYLVAGRFYLVDLPGYGYARVSKKMRKQWAHLIETYVTDNADLRLMVAILDIRRDPSEDDLDLIEWLESVGIRYVIALTKSDKVSGNEFAKQSRRIREAVQRRIAESTGSPETKEPETIRFSAKTSVGRNELINAILAAVAKSSRSGAAPPGGRP